MKNIKNVLVALDLSEIDTKLIEYASFLAEKLSLEKVYFVHNIKKYEISELFAEQLKDINLDGLITEEIEDKLKNHFSATSETEILISEDHYTESLINYVANKYLIDLLIVGNKDHQTGTGVIPDKLLRLMKCDILAIPKNASEKLENIWIGTDFSKESRKSFDKLNPYIVLGCDPSDDFTTIRKKYLKLSKEHHPDVLVSKGVPKEVIEESKKKMRAINSAFDTIEKMKSG